MKEIDMGAARLPTTSDELYTARRARYLKTRDELLAKAKERYAAERPFRLAFAKQVRDAAREARLAEKRKGLYGEKLERQPGQPRGKRLSCMLREFKTGKPCLDCGRIYPYYVMEFDHVRGKKHRDVSDCRTVSSLNAEMAKCDLVCANCHRERTFSRRTDLYK